MALPQWQYPEGYLDFIREQYADPEGYGFIRDDFEEAGLSQVASSTAINPSPWTLFTHEPTVPQPKGVLVVCGHGNTTEHVTAVSYGGVALPLVDFNITVGAEDYRVYAWFLGDETQIPEGPQDVVVTHDGSSGTKFFMCVTYDGLGDMEVITTAEAASPAQDWPFIYPIDTGSRLAYRYMIWATGYGSMNDIDPDPPMVRLGESAGADAALDRLEDQGRGSKAIIMQDTSGGLTGSGDDFVALMLAIGTTPTLTGSTLGVHEYETARVLFSYLPPYLTEEPLLRDLIWAQAIELDHIRAALDSYVAGQFIEYAEEWALRLWEADTGRLVAPDGLTQAQRRAGVLAVVGSSARTIEDFVAFTAEFFNIDPALVEIVENFATYTIQVNVQTGLSEAQQEAFEHSFRRILPAHLAVNFNYGAFIAGVSLAGDTV